MHFASLRDLRGDPSRRHAHVFLERYDEGAGRLVANFERHVFHIQSSGEQRDGAADSRALPPFAERHSGIGGGTRNDNGRLIITSVRRNTAGIDAGLNVDDEIIAIDDVRVRAADGLAQRLAQYRLGDKVSMTVARRDRLIKLAVTLGTDPGRPWRLEQSPNATAEQKARFEALMTGR